MVILASTFWYSQSDWNSSLASQQDNLQSLMLFRHMSFCFCCCVGHRKQQSLVPFRHCYYVGYQQQWYLMSFRHCYCVGYRRQYPLMPFRRMLLLEFVSLETVKELLFYKTILTILLLESAFSPDRQGLQCWKTFFYIPNQPSTTGSFFFWGRWHSNIGFFPRKIILLATS